MIQFHEVHETSDTFADDVYRGLEKRPASVPPKYFYDAAGSLLFDRITHLPEYYPTRTEIDILSRNASEIADLIGTGNLLVEPGGGSLSKIHILLEGLQPRAYVPMDISRDHLKFAVAELSAAYPWLEIHAACTDFTREMRLPETAPGGTRVAFFPGSSIGNFDQGAAVDFLVSISKLVGPGGYLLIGVDLKKDIRILEAAYNDAAGVTAQFNLNLLSHINRVLDADFDLANWRHKACYNDSAGRIEMHLAGTCDQIVKVGSRGFSFGAGETIHTENSYKYTKEEFTALAARAGFRSVKIWLDDADLFSVHLFRARPVDSTGSIPSGDIHQSV